METYYILGIAAAALGAIVGSFLNALLFRYNTGRSVLHGRSHCMRCSHTLTALDLVPLLSFVALRGRCRYCDTRLSWQYPAVELAGALLAVGVYLKYDDPLLFAVGFLTWMTLLFIVVYDLKHQIIPWEASIALGVLALLHVGLSGFGVWAVAAGPLLAFPLLFISLVSGGRWMGWGDGILELGLGWMLGLSAGASAFMLAFWTGACVGVALLWYSQRSASKRSAGQGGYTMESEVAFAPFLILGAGCAYFLNVDFFQTVAILFS